MTKVKMFLMVIMLSTASIINAQEPSKVTNTCYLYKDTIQIKEIKIKDSVLAIILDSAFATLKYTSINSYPNYFELYSDKSVERLKSVTFYVRNMFKYSKNAKTTANAYLNKYCLVYKGVQILIDSSYINSYWLGQYISITGYKIPYYVYGYYTKDKKDVCQVNEKFIEQEIRFSLNSDRRNPFTFIIYRCEISENLSYGQDN